MTEPALSSYTPPKDPPATLDQLAEALRVLLLPDPLLSFLPTALEYLSTFQRLAEVIYHEARAVVLANDRLGSQLEDNGVPHGALTAEEVEQLRKVGGGFRGLQHHYSNEMMELSIQLRLFHSAALLASPVAISQARGIISQYFPREVSQAADGCVSHRYMKTERYVAYKSTLDQKQEELEHWYQTTETAVAGGGKRPTVAFLMSSVEACPVWSPKHPSQLAERIMRSVELVLEHVRILQDMFPHESEETIDSGAVVEDVEERGGIHFDGADVTSDPREEILSSNDYSTHPVATNMENRTSTQSVFKRRTAHDSPRDVKRPRTSTAPDYTAPSAKMGSRVDKAFLRPFDDSEFRRTPSGKAGSQESTSRKAVVNSAKQGHTEL